MKFEFITYIETFAALMTSNIEYRAPLLYHSLLAEVDAATLLFNFFFMVFTSQFLLVLYEYQRIDIEFCLQQIT